MTPGRATRSGKSCAPVEYRQGRKLRQYSKFRRLREKARAVIARMAEASPRRHTRSQQDAVILAGQDTPDSLKGQYSPEAVRIAPLRQTRKNAVAPTCLHYGKFCHKLYGQKNYFFCSNCRLFEVELGTANPKKGSRKTFPCTAVHTSYVFLTSNWEARRQ
jgi:hypothetical protein